MSKKRYLVFAAILFFVFIFVFTAGVESAKFFVDSTSNVKTYKISGSGLTINEAVEAFARNESSEKPLEMALWTQSSYIEARSDVLGTSEQVDVVVALGSLGLIYPQVGNRVVPEGQCLVSEEMSVLLFGGKTSGQGQLHVGNAKLVAIDSVPVDGRVLIANQSDVADIVKDERIEASERATSNSNPGSSYESLRFDRLTIREINDGVSIASYESLMSLIGSQVVEIDRSLIKLFLSMCLALALALLLMYTVFVCFSLYSMVCSWAKNAIYLICVLLIAMLFLCSLSLFPEISQYLPTRWADSDSWAAALEQLRILLKVLAVEGRYAPDYPIFLSGLNAVTAGFASSIVVALEIGILMRVEVLLNKKNEHTSIKGDGNGLHRNKKCFKIIRKETSKIKRLDSRKDNSKSFAIKSSFSPAYARYRSKKEDICRKEFRPHYRKR